MVRTGGYIRNALDTFQSVFAEAMELPITGVFGVARTAAGTNRVSATVKFPHTFDLSTTPAEIGLKYVAISPTWRRPKDMTMIVTDLEAGGASLPKQVQFNINYRTPRQDIIPHIRDTLSKAFPEKTPLVRLRMTADRKDNVIRVRKGTTVSFSPDLAELLGFAEIGQELWADEEEEVIKIKLKEEGSDFRESSCTDMYLLKCDQCASRFYTDGRQDRVLDVFYVPGTEVVQFHPVFPYTALEMTAIQSLTFTLYDHDNQPVVCESPDMYVTFHIRPRFTQ